MRLATIRQEGAEVAGIVTKTGVLPVKALNTAKRTAWKEDMYSLIKAQEIPELTKWYNDGGREELERISGIVPQAEVVYGPLYRTCSRIWGIGLNYRDHAGDLSEKTPVGIPGSFIKLDTTIIGDGDAVKIPVQSERTTAEAELGVIMGRECRDIEREDWLKYVAGFTTILDQTAEDILRLNPRYLTMVKNYDTFFSFGPELVTPDEVADVEKLKVRTIHNGEVHAENVVANMTFAPDWMVSYYSKAFTWKPGAILSTGTPRAVVIADGDTVGCQIDGFRSLENKVVDLKVKR